MVDVLYTIEREFMQKTFESIDRHVRGDSAYVPLRPEARGCCDAIQEIPVEDVADVDENVREVDPGVVIYNHHFRTDEIDFHEEYPLVHVRHGASIGRDEIRTTNEHVLDVVDTALAPGEMWATRYRNCVDTAVVGIPEADDLSTADPPRERRVLYAPTNHNYGAGSYLNTAEHVIDVFADTEYELLFRPHPMDRTEEPGRTLTERCKRRIADLPNVVFDENPTPRESMLDSDVLVSDYSGIIAEWLHTDRPLVQFTNVASEEHEVPEIGYATDRLDLETVDDLYEHGYPERLKARVERFNDELGIPMDGRAGERAAAEVMACTQ